MTETDTLEPILQFFHFEHLPAPLQAVSKPFGELARAIVHGATGEAGLPRNPERTVALRKLLEAKDAAVRASLFKTALIIACALSIAACSPPAAPNVTVNVHNVVNVTTTINFSTPQQSTAAECAAIGSLEINRPESLRAGDRGDVLVTPKDSSGQKRTPECDIKDGITLSATPTDVLAVEDAHAFVTKVTGGPKTGTGRLTVTVGRASGTVEIPVR